MNGLKVMTFWVRPQGEAALPRAGERLEHLLLRFYRAFPEYEGCLQFSQSPRRPGHVFVYAAPGCPGLLPGAGSYVQQELKALFPDAEVRPYGKAWQRTES